MNIRIVFIILLLLGGRAVAVGKLNVTAISAHRGHSTLECREIDSPFFLSRHPSTKGAMMVDLGGVSNASLSVIPPVFDNGLHNAPYAQSVLFIIVYY